LTYTILTTEADEMMSKIHNTKKRMPIILKMEDEKLYLESEDIKKYTLSYTTDKLAF